MAADEAATGPTSQELYDRVFGENVYDYPTPEPGELVHEGRALHRIAIPGQRYPYPDDLLDQLVKSGMVAQVRTYWGQLMAWQRGGDRGAWTDDKYRDIYMTAEGIASLDRPPPVPTVCYMPSANFDRLLESVQDCLKERRNAKDRERRAHKASVTGQLERVLRELVPAAHITARRVPPEESGNPAPTSMITLHLSDDDVRELLVQLTLPLNDGEDRP